MFEVRTKRLTVTEKNTYKTVKELRLFEVVSYTEAEVVASKHIGEQFPGEDFQISKISASKINEVDKFDNESENPFWKVKVNELHEKENGRIKRVPVFILVQAESSAQANEKAEILVRAWVMPTEIVKVELTKFCEIVKRTEESTPAKVEKPKKGKK